MAHADLIKEPDCMIARVEEYTQDSSVGQKKGLLGHTSELTCCLGAAHAKNKADHQVPDVHLRLLIL
jgi:hypothetical protein